MISIRALVHGLQAFFKGYVSYDWRQCPDVGLAIGSVQGHPHSMVVLPLAYDSVALYKALSLQ